MRRAEPADLEGWDARVVEARGGHVFQSQAWARHRARFGWQPRFLVADDGFPVLALVRPWVAIGGGSAYVSRGPAPVDDPSATARREVEVAEWLAGDGVDVVAADPEVPADGPFLPAIRAAGFHQIEELQPSRHRLDVALPAAGDDDGLLGSFSATTRNLIRQAERQVEAGELVVRAIDRRSAPAGDGRRPATVAGPEEGTAIGRLYDLLAETAGRRGFWLANRPTFDSWTTEALEAGLLLALLVEGADGGLLAGATFFRHGGRLTYALSGEATTARRSHPGATRLLLWRAMQQAMDEGRWTMDLGGVDLPGARRRPEPGEPAHGMLAFKESFGATWQELAGAHERVLRPLRYGAGRVIARLRAR